MKNTIQNSENFYYIYGKHTVLAALRNQKRNVKNIFLTHEVFLEHTKLISKFPYEIKSIDFFYKKFQSKEKHQGITAVVKTIFEDDITKLDFNATQYKIAILDQITNPQNIGAIIRSAALFDINAIIIAKNNAPNENGLIAKSASGGLENVRIIRVTNIKKSIDYLKKQNFWILGLDLNSELELTNKLFSDKIAIVLGSENKGIRKLVKDSCDLSVKIKTSNKIDSLNVSNAAAIAFYIASTY